MASVPRGWGMGAIPIANRLAAFAEPFLNRPACVLMRAHEG